MSPCDLSARPGLCGGWVGPSAVLGISSIELPTSVAVDSAVREEAEAPPIHDDSNSKNINNQTSIATCSGGFSSESRGDEIHPSGAARPAPTMAQAPSRDHAAPPEPPHLEGYAPQPCPVHRPARGTTSTSFPTEEKEEDTKAPDIQLSAGGGGPPDLMMVPPVGNYLAAHCRASVLSGHLEAASGHARALPAAVDTAPFLQGWTVVAPAERVSDPCYNTVVLPHPPPLPLAPGVPQKAYGGLGDGWRSVEGIPSAVVTA